MRRSHSVGSRGPGEVSSRGRGVEPSPSIRDLANQDSRPRPRFTTSPSAREFGAAGRSGQPAGPFASPQTPRACGDGARVASRIDPGTVWWLPAVLWLQSVRLRPRGEAVSYTHLRAHETRHDLVCR